MDYNSSAKSRIQLEKIPANPQDRLTEPVAKLIDKDIPIDVHTHLFDMNCINKSYFVIQSLKDLVGVDKEGKETKSFSGEEAYKDIRENVQGWEKKLVAELSSNKIKGFIDGAVRDKGFIDKVNLLKFLTFDKMKKVYRHYVKEYSVAEAFGKPKEDVIIAVLMMDLEIGWETNISKNFHDQVTELKEIASSEPVLPFLYTDPRRADIESEEENLYSLFNFAFTGEVPFFGVKVYPAMGYDPNDHRLWPIYRICESLQIPVLTHCGGDAVSTYNEEQTIYRGTEKVTLVEPERKKMAYNLNDPARWEPVLQQFPNLKLNLGHFGAYATWTSTGVVAKEKDPQGRKEKIFELMETYPHVYADFSYSLVDEDISQNLYQVLLNNPTVADRTLFGSDFWVVNTYNLPKEQGRFIEQLGEVDAQHGRDLLKKLAFVNPRNYLLG